jgi:hypothetical protein
MNMVHVGWDMRFYFIFNFPNLDKPTPIPSSITPIPNNKNIPTNKFNNILFLSNNNTSF